MDIFKQAVEYLATADPILTGYMRAHQTNHNPPKPPVSSHPDQYELDLCKIIVSQQISTKAADAVWKRLRPVLADRQSDEELLREQGLSRQKASYIAEIIRQNRDLTQLTSMSDEDVIIELTKYKGVGRWSAEMFLMFSLARPDVFSIGDLGLRTAISQLYNIDRNDVAKIEAITTKWSPHRTTASLYLWHMID